MPTSKKQAAAKRRWPYALGIAGLVLGALIAFNLFFSPSRSGPDGSDTGKAEKPPFIEKDSAVFKRYAGSKSCQSCHGSQYEAWLNSHHGLAERPIQADKDRSAFHPPRQIADTSEAPRARATNSTYQIVAQDQDGKKRPFTVTRVLGTEPLKQFLIPTRDGRIQACSWVVGSESNDWFNVFGDENRQPGEWGHWTGRGMNWNSMCASCHNTRLRKHYNPQQDSYNTTMAEMGVSCESCHGPMQDHVDWQRNYSSEESDPTIPDFSATTRMEACAKCHSRRSELTGDFHPGENYFDHYSLVIPDDTETYYPDGQVNEENYVYTSFLSSKMHQAGVSCMDCHEPHSAELRMQGNQLCMQCHNGQRQDSPVIDPAAHSHHRPGSPGGRCVDCHMPETVYMQRDPRRDHGFTIPDPLLTKKYNIPNACNRCHEDQTADWAHKHVQKWYGDAMERHSRDRATWVAEARRGNTNVIDDLLHMAQGETNDVWRAVGTTLLERWGGRSDVTETLIDNTKDPSPIVRGAAAQSLAPQAEQPSSPVHQPLRALLDDPLRKVRIDAAWALRTELDMDTAAATDLMRYLDFNQDQPSGALQRGVFEFDRDNPKASLPYLRRAVEWDPNSAPIRHALAVSLSAVGKPSQAVQHLQVACELEPDHADYRYRLGLAYNEAGKLNQAIQSLEKAVDLDPQYGRAWYNLGLAYSQVGQPQEAIDALLRAESINDQSPRIPYARATILVRLGRRGEAIRAAERALELAPNYPPAANLLRKLGAR